MPLYTTVMACFPAGSVWVVWDNSLLRIAAGQDQTVARLVLGRLPGGFTGLVVAAGALWAQNEFTGTLYRVDPTVDRAEALHVGSNGPLAAAPGGVWLSACPGPTSRKTRPGVAASSWIPSAK